MSTVLQLSDTQKQVKWQSQVGPRWYTPKVYIKAAREVMGDIDLDPATDEDAQKRIKAKVYYTAETNGLNKEWNGRFLCCTPYKEPTIGQFIQKAVSEYLSGRAYEGIILTHSSTTESDWFQLAASTCSAMCFHRGNIKWFPGHRAYLWALKILGYECEFKYSVHGSVFFYFGKNRERFVDVFSRFGVVL